MTRLELLQARVTVCRRRVKEAKERVQNMPEWMSAARGLEDAEDELAAAEQAVNDCRDGQEPISSSASG